MHSRTILTTGNFFIAVAATLTSYTLFPYLSTFISTVYLGVAISLGGVVATILFFFLPRLVRRFGAQQLALYFAFTELIMLFAVASAPSTIISAVLVILVISLQPLIYYQFDLLLEATVDNESTTGRVRTFFMTGGNIGSLVAPLLIGTLMVHADSYMFVFFAAAATMMPLIALLSVHRLPKGAAPTTAQIKDTVTCITCNRDLSAVTVSHLILYFFYVWAPFYVPLYLHGVIGIPWSTLGWMFSIMLIPYILIEYPAGWLADNIFGDKEMMLLGFLIMGLSLGAVGFISSSTAPWLIILILMGTRTGAALVESMTEGHFFRRVSEQNIVSVSIFRGVWPAADIIAPLIGSVIFYIDGYQLFFLITGAFVGTAGIISTLFIRDFR